MADKTTSPKDGISPVPAPAPSVAPSPEGFAEPRILTESEKNPEAANDVAIEGKFCGNCGRQLVGIGASKDGEPMAMCPSCGPVEPFFVAPTNFETLRTQEETTEENQKVLDAQKKASEKDNEPRLKANKDKVKAEEDKKKEGEKRQAEADKKAKEDAKKAAEAKK